MPCSLCWPPHSNLTALHAYKHPTQPQNRQVHRVLQRILGPQGGTSPAHCWPLPPTAPGIPGNVGQLQRRAGDSVLSHYLLPQALPRLPASYLPQKLLVLLAQSLRLLCHRDEQVRKHALPLPDAALGDVRRVAQQPLQVGYIRLQARLCHSTWCHTSQYGERQAAELPAAKASLLVRLLPQPQSFQARLINYQAPSHPGIALANRLGSGMCCFAGHVVQRAQCNSNLSLALIPGLAPSLAHLCTVLPVLEEPYAPALVLGQGDGLAGKELPHKRVQTIKRLRTLCFLARSQVPALNCYFLPAV